MKKTGRSIPVVSIIIPVYNAEKYLKQSIESVLNQSYPFFELICVDDGSTDKSYDILKQYKSQDSRIMIIKQQNQYAGTARNKGMQAASGKFVLFLDADDFFCKDMLELIVKRAEEKQTEILVFDAYRFDNEQQRVNQLNWKPLDAKKFGEGVKPANKIADVIFDFTVPSAWNKLYLREFIRKNDLWFQNLKRTNDLFFVYAAFVCAEKIGILEQKLVYYRDNNEESLQGSSADTPAVFSGALFALQDFLKDKGIWKIYQESFEHMALSICVYHLSRLKNADAYIQLCAVLKRDVIPRIYADENILSGIVITAIRTRQELIVYGAGALAVAFIRFLIYQASYAVDKILVAVSDTKNNVSEICGVEVRNFETVSDSYRNNCIMIAVSDKSIQNEIEKNIRINGYEKIIRLDFHCFADIIKQW